MLQNIIGIRFIAVIADDKDEDGETFFNVTRKSYKAIIGKLYASCEDNHVYLFKPELGINDHYFTVSEMIDIANIMERITQLFE